VIGALGLADSIELGGAGLFQDGVVVVVDDVKAGDAITALDQATGDMIGDEAGAVQSADANTMAVPFAAPKSKESLKSFCARSRQPLLCSKPQVRCPRA